jgi:hypothetical protein
VASEILKSNEMYRASLGTQTLPTQTVIPGTVLEFPVPQNVFNEIYTEFDVTQNGVPAPASDYSVTDGKITFHTLDAYTVKMTNKAIISISDYPAEVIFNVNKVGIKEVIQKPDVTIYPNPAYSTFQIKGIDDFQNVTVSIYNMYGQIVVYEQTVNKDDVIHVEDLCKGVYIVNISIENKIVDKCKLIKL